MDVLLRLEVGTEEDVDVAGEWKTVAEMIGVRALLLLALIEVSLDNVVED